MLIAMTSAKGAPGVTTAALALALSWPRRTVLAELDPAGGDVLAGYGRGPLVTRHDAWESCRPERGVQHP